MRRCTALLFATLLATLPGMAPAVAQETYPNRAITLVVPYAPGGASDLLARTLAEALRVRLKESVIVQNVGGAGSVVGSLQVAKARPDGYTLLLNHIGLSTIPALYRKLNFDRRCHVVEPEPQDGPARYFLKLPPPRAKCSLLMRETPGV